MLLVILLTCAWAACAPWIVRRTGRHAGWVLALGPLAVVGWVAAHAGSALAGTGLRETVAWVPTLGVEAAFMLDGLSLLFVLLIAGLGAVITAYAGRYLEGHPDLGRFYVTLLAFLAAMLGVVTADHLILLFIFWEGTSLCSYLLVGFKHESKTARSSALQALLVTGAGGLALLAGFILLRIAGGSWEISTLLTQANAIQAHPLYIPAFALIALGAFTKSAQVPFHFWLPNAMAAPTPVSAYLHSATMVKAGVYLLARLDPALGGTGVWIWTLSIVGSATMLVGAVGALRHTDLKKVLAYSTLTALGTLVVLLGLSYDASIKAAIVFLIVHALYKSGLFLVAGTVDHATGTRDVMRLGGLRRMMPWTALAAVLAGLSMAGLPPLFGFVGKELTYKAKLGVENLGWLLPAVAVMANALTVAAAGALVARPFFGRARSPEAASAHEAPLALWIGPALIGALGLVFGVAPGLLMQLVAPAVDVVAGEPTEIKLALWYGVNTALYLSIATVVLGVAAYAAWPRVQPVLAQWADAVARLGPAHGYTAALTGVVRLGTWTSRLMDGGNLRRALSVTFLTLVVAVGGTLLAKGAPLSLAAAWDVLPHEAALVALIGAAALTAAATATPLLALTSLGVAGIGLAILFVLLSAPDLAMTQVLVEILLVVIALAVLQAVPAGVQAESRGRSMRDAAVALGVGSTVTVLLLAVLRLPFDGTVPAYYLNEAVPQGFGRNVVNVILVDFRALDTLGEIAVLAIAALGALVLLDRPVRKAAGLRPMRTLAPSLVLQTGARLLLALLLLAAVFMLWRGHNEPGGGFIGGLFAASAVVLYLLAYRRSATERLLRVAPRTGLGVGLAIAVLSGLAGMTAGLPFLTGRWTALGSVKLGTPLLFDVGVFLVVVGFTLTLILALDRVLTSSPSDDALPDDAPPPRSSEETESPLPPPQRHPAELMR